MKAIVIHETGSANQMLYEDVPLPTPEAGEVQVKLAAAGVNFIDIYHRRGWYPKELPFTPGLEGAGVVSALGAGVTEFQMGDRVAFTSAPASYAEFVKMPASSLVSIPDGVAIDIAAAAMLQGLTAHYLATTTYPIKEGDTALVHACAGGVGLLLTQIIKMLGGTVIGTTSTPEKAEMAKAMGADHVILYTEQDFVAETKRITNGAGVEVVYDSVGKDTFDGSLNCLKLLGMLALYGQASGPVPPLDLQILNQKGSLSISRPSLFHYIATREAFERRCADMFGWIADGRLQVRIDRKFPLAEASEAHKYMEARKTKGKVLLVP